MGLFGALSSGVSGLTAQSSAMGAIADNITNVNTIGYKGTQVNFQTLVTRQTSSTFFSAGGVQSRPRTDAGIQGLLQSSTSQTDLGISGSGFFVVNEAAVPTLSNEFLFTRAGQFFQDNQGYLRNTAGFYLQAFPVDPAGEIIPNNSDILIANTNVISTDFLTTVNLNRVGGTATATTGIAVGANLPSNATSGQTHRSDVQFFDSLGTARNISFQYTRTGRENQWNVAVDPPSGNDVLTLEDANGNAYDSRGQVEFDNIPSNRSSISIDGISYQFQNFGTLTASGLNPITITDAGAADVISANVGTFSKLAAGDEITISDPNAAGGFTTGTALIASVATDGSSITLQSSVVAANEGPLTADWTMNVTDTNDVKIVDTSSSTTTANYVSQLVAKVKASDSDFADHGGYTNTRVSVSPFNASTVLFNEDGTDDITVDPSGLLTSSGTNATKQTTSFTVNEVNSAYRDSFQFKFTRVPDDGDTLTINGIVYEFDSDATVTGTNIAVDITATEASTVAADISTFLGVLETAIEANDPQFATGASTARLRRADTTTDGANFSTVDTLVLDTLSSGAYTIQFSSGFANSGGATTLPENTNDTSQPTDASGSTLDDQSTFSIDKTSALVFDSSGLPSAINIAEIEMLGFANGAANFDDDPANTDQITLDFGTVGIADGLTQFGDEFTPGFIEQDGSQFGTFAGITVSDDGLVTALFDNGETRPVFKIPIATFVNVNELGSRTGNVFNSTQASGDPTLRTANSGPAGAITQSALEASTVDIGEEFTKMIVVQRAFSAATKIITTADEMLDELVRLR